MKVSATGFFLTKKDENPSHHDKLEKKAPQFLFRTHYANSYILTRFILRGQLHVRQCYKLGASEIWMVINQELSEIEHVLLCGKKKIKTTVLILTAKIGSLKAYSEILLLDKPFTKTSSIKTAMLICNSHSKMTNSQDNKRQTHQLNNIRCQRNSVSKTLKETTSDPKSTFRGQKAHLVQSCYFLSPLSSATVSA